MLGVDIDGGSVSNGGGREPSRMNPVVFEKIMNPDNRIVSQL